MACELYTFDLCSRFHVAYDTHDMCATCRHKEGHQECTRDLNCQYCTNWSDIEWSLYEHNLQQKGYRRQKKLDKTQLQFLWKTPWQLALKILKTRQQRNRRWKIPEVSLSLLTKSRPKGLLSRGIWTMRCHQHLPGGWREMVIGVTRTGIAVAIGVRMIPTRKDIFTNGHQVPEAARETWLVRAPHGAVIPLNPKLTVQLESLPPGTGLPGTKVQLESAHHGAGLPLTEAQLDLVPHGTGLPWARVQLEPTPHGAGLPRTIQLESFPEGTGLPQTNTLDTVPPGAKRPRVGLLLEPCPLGTGPLRTGLQAIGLPPPARKVLLPWSPVELELTLRLLPTVREPFPLGIGPPLTILETSPRDPSPSGVEVTADASPAGAGSLQNWSAVYCPDCLPGGRIFQVKTPSAYTVTATNRADTADRGSSVAGRTVRLKPAVWTDQADTVRVVSMATHTTGDTGPQSTQLTGPLQPPVQQPVTRTITLERVQTEPWKLYQFSLQCQFMAEIQHCPMFLYRLWWVCIKSIQHGNALYWHGCAGPSDLAAQMGTSIMQQQAQDVYWIQPPQFGPLDQQMLFPGLQFVQQPTATAGALSQQAQNAVTMASAMWMMMNTVLQQHQRMVYPGYGPGTHRTPLHQNAGTPRCPGGMATPRFSAPASVHTMPPGTSMVAAFTVFLAGKTDYD